MRKMDEKHIFRNLMLSGAILSGIYAIMIIVNKKNSKDNLQSDSQINKFHGGYKSTICKKGYYEKYVKLLLDKIMAFGGLVLLSPIFAVLSLAVYIDDPGPVFFTQKRIGKDKQLFELHKFRSMKMCTPHDVPTHQLSNPEKYITKVGKILRRTSLDELPQIWDILCGNMSIIGPRPALWNQEDLVKERDIYGANSVRPGLTGLAQINGRDEIEISEKAKLDGEYVKVLRQGGIKALFFDAKCFLGTIKAVVNSEGVVEGGTGAIKKERISKLNAYNMIHKKDFL